MTIRHNDNASATTHDILEPDVCDIRVDKAGSFFGEEYDAPFLDELPDSFVYDAAESTSHDPYLHDPWTEEDVDYEYSRSVYRMLSEFATVRKQHIEVIPYQYGYELLVEVYLETDRIPPTQYPEFGSMKAIHEYLLRTYNYFK